MGKAEKKREQRIALGKFFYDLSKLAFAALVLGSLLTYFQSDEQIASIVTMLISGIVMSLAFAIFANNLNR
jgi:uncharacterized membrane-anchored protein